MAKRTTQKSVPIDAVKHQDKRKNIPTEELRGFVSEEDAKPKNVTYEGLLYARDPSLDPQLVWKGKDEQDRQPLTVPSVPVYIQEKIHPRAIIEELRAEAKKAAPEDQLNLFSDFNGIKFEDLIEFYQHEQNWSNRMILGDSLLVMTSLAERENLKGRVQMVYIDPPYGIKFGSNWQVSTRKRDVKDGKAEDATRQPEQIRAFRDTWEFGVSSYLSYWRDRLVAARDLLTEAGSVFVQIGDENVHLVRSVMDEIFGVDNFCSQVTVSKTAGQSAQLLGGLCDYVLWYAKSKGHVKFRSVLVAKNLSTDSSGVYKWVQNADGIRRKLSDDEADEREPLPDGSRIFRIDNITSQRPPGDFPVEFEGKKYKPGKGYWKSGESGMARLVRGGRVLKSGDYLAYKRFLEDFPAVEIGNLWTDTGTGSFTDEKLYVVQTSSKIIARCILMTTDPGDLVLDPTCGSGTTAYVAEQWGRRWITCDTSRVALALARTRLMCGRFPYYLLSDSPEGARKESEILGRASLGSASHGQDIRKGFVCKRVPHVTLKAIANNEEIDVIHEKCQPQIDNARTRINNVLGTEWQDWEVPRDIKDIESWLKSKDQKISKDDATFLGLAFGEYWHLRKQKQKAIDDSIAKRADTEILHNQPYEDNKRVRVSGPFTIESLSPHRSISFEKKQRLATEGLEGRTVKIIGAGQFGNIMIENLRKAGVQNTIKKERLSFDRLEHHAGLWIHAAGDYTDKEGKSRRAAICIGPEHGTVGAELIREAAKEAVQGIGYDILIVCGFAFDPNVTEEAKKYGKLTVLPTRINADLQMGDEFLKKTGAANLFTVFGEPDLDIKKAKDGKVTIEIRGLDVYDPTTGQIRNNTTDDIACWFVDTNYNGESFFVRHAYFTGAGDPYDSLRRALKAEINEAAWSALYATKSRPFDPPKTGKIAVKIINHYGDEVLKVYDLKQGG